MFTAHRKLRRKDRIFTKEVLMLWLEMSRDEDHGGGDWGFTKCLWAPTRKKGLKGGNWPYWDAVMQALEGDLVLHLRGRGKKAAFVGYSRVDAAGYKTSERPPIAGQWEYSNSFYVAQLKEFIQFPEPVFLNTLLQSRKAELTEYFKKNKSRPKNLRKSIFFVIQAGRLQCLNGAYLSQIDSELASILTDVPLFSQNVNSKKDNTAKKVETGQKWGELWQRVGQSAFSEQVRENYKSQCCFPDCTVTERRFLVGSHIGRWADSPGLRGEISNGLCFCLMHDKAFESGMFTLSSTHTVCVNDTKVTESQWAKQNLVPFGGEEYAKQKLLHQSKPSNSIGHGLNLIHPQNK